MRITFRTIKMCCSHTLIKTIQNVFNLSGCNNLFELHLNKFSRQTFNLYYLNVAKINSLQPLTLKTLLFLIF